MYQGSWSRLCTLFTPLHNQADNNTSQLVTKKETHSGKFLKMDKIVPPVKPGIKKAAWYFIPCIKVIPCYLFKIGSPSDIFSYVSKWQKRFTYLTDMESDVSNYTHWEIFELNVTPNWFCSVIILTLDWCKKKKQPEAIFSVDTIAVSNVLSCFLGLVNTPEGWF